MLHQKAKIRNFGFKFNSEMTDLAKWVWIIIIVIFFVGTDIFWIIGASALAVLLIWWLKPEWLNKK